MKIGFVRFTSCENHLCSSNFLTVGLFFGFVYKQCEIRSLTLAEILILSGNLYSPLIMS